MVLLLTVVVYAAVIQRLHGATTRGPVWRQASADRTFRSFMSPDLLIMDNLRLHCLTAQQSTDLYKLILNRHRASIFVFISNRAVDD